MRKRRSILGLLCTIGLLACGNGLSGPQAQAVALHVRAVGSAPPVEFEFSVGDTAVVFEAYAINADSTIIGPAIPVAWESNDTAVATITQQGILRVRCVGIARISAMDTVAGRQLSGQVEIAVGSVGPECYP